MTWMIRSALILSLSLVTFTAMAGEAYKVSATLSHQGEAFAAPVLLVKRGVAARIATSGPAGYGMSVTVDPLSDGSLRVASRVDSAHGEMAPVLVVDPGQVSSVSVGDLSLSLTVAPADG